VSEKNKENRIKAFFAKFKKKRSVSDTKKEQYNAEESKIIKSLNGTTLMVYFALLNKKEIGVRELQRSLSLSSPSVAKYHLEKIAKLGLAENRNGIYHLLKKAKIPSLTSYILIGQNLIPRILFAAVFFTVLFAIYLIFFYTIWIKDSFFVILFGSIINLYLWFEVFLRFKNKPI
jgi:DNA-binding MarR family transcriptional regulator